MENMETEDEPITDGFSPEYVKEEISKLMVYKVQAYEQLIVIDKLREAIKWFVEKYAYKMKTETKQKLFNHMSDEHSLTLLQSEMFEIENILKPDWMEIVEAAFIAGHSKTSWEQFKKDNDL